MPYSVDGFELNIKEANMNKQKPHKRQDASV
jgi:hypothetical protein